MAITKKKLLIFVPTFPVLSETFIQREIQELGRISKDYSVQVFSLAGNGVDGLNVLYARVSPLDILQGVLTFGLKNFLYFSSLLQENKARSLWNRLYLVAKSYGYAYKINKLEVSHIHAHFLSESSTLMFFVAKLLNKPFSISAHARDVFATSKDVTALPELVSIKADYAKFIVICNRKAYQKCLELVGSKLQNKVFLHYHGINPDTLPNSGHQPFNNEPYTFVSVGRLVEKKGFMYLIEAVNQLKNRLHSVKFLIIGPGPKYEELTKLIEKYSVGEYVEICGGGKGMPNREVLNIMSTSDGYILPSIETAEGDAEGVPNTLVEAAFLGLPIIATKTGSIADFIVNNDNGVLIEPKSSESIVNSVLSLVEHVEMARNLGSNAKKSAATMFDMRKNIMELDKLFSENLA